MRKRASIHLGRRSGGRAASKQAELAQLGRLLRNLKPPSMSQRRATWGACDNWHATESAPEAQGAHEAARARTKHNGRPAGRAAYLAQCCDLGATLLAERAAPKTMSTQIGGGGAQTLLLGRPALPMIDAPKRRRPPARPPALCAPLDPAATAPDLSGLE